MGKKTLTINSGHFRFKISLSIWNVTELNYKCLTSIIFSYFDCFCPLRAVYFNFVIKNYVNHIKFLMHLLNQSIFDQINISELLWKGYVPWEGIIKRMLDYILISEHNLLIKEHKFSILSTQEILPRDKTVNSNGCLFNIKIPM
jgi:hypothetical protein